jgi:hypothetical protein
MNFAKTIPSTNYAPDEPTCLEKLQAMWWISKVIYAFIDKKNQILPEDCVNDLTSWYLNCLGDFQRLLKLSQFDEMTDNTHSKIAECICALASIVYGNGAIISVNNQNLVLGIDGQIGVLTRYLSFFPDNNNSKYLSTIPKRAVQVLYALCVQNRRKNVVESSPQLRKKCIARIRDSFQKYWINFGRVNLDTELAHGRYLLSIAKGLYIIIGHMRAEDDPIDKFEVEKLLYTAHYLMTVGVKDAPLDHQLTIEVAKPVPESIIDPPNHQRFRGKIPHSRGPKYRQARPSNGNAGQSKGQIQKRKKQIGKNQENITQTQLDESPIFSMDDSPWILINSSEGHSESEGLTSDSEDGQSRTDPKIMHERKHNKILMHVREAALKALYCMVKVFQKQALLGFWESFLAMEYNKTPLEIGQKVNLFTTLWLDSSQICRMQACAVLSMFCMTNRQFFVTMANEKPVVKVSKFKAGNRMNNNTMNGNANSVNNNTANNNSANNNWNGDTNNSGANSKIGNNSPSRFSNSRLGSSRYSANSRPAVNQNSTTVQNAMGVKLAQRLRFTVTSLISVLQEEKYNQVKTSLLNSITKIVQNVNFNKLNDGIILEIMDNACLPFMPELNKKISTDYAKVVRGLVDLICSILKIQPDHQEVAKIVENENGKYDWILKYALEFSKTRAVSGNTKPTLNSKTKAKNYQQETDSLKDYSSQLLQTLTRHQPALIKGHEQEIFNFACESIVDEKLSDDEKLSYLALLEYVMVAINERCKTSDEFKPTREAMWKKAFESRAIELSYNNDFTIAAVANFLATIDSESFEKIPAQHKYIRCITLGTVDRFTLGSGSGQCTLPSETKNEIIGAGIRSAGMLCNFESFQDDFQFLDQLAEAVLRAHPLSFEHTTVSYKIRQNTAWATANLTECLLRNKEQLKDDLEGFYYPHELFQNLIKLSTRACADKADRVVPHGLRAIGKLTYLYLEIYPLEASEHTKNLLEPVYKTLSKILTTCDDTKITKSKIRWNAACAIQEILKSENFQENKGKKNEIMIMDFVSAAVLAFVETEIFKVKNHCADCIFRIKFIETDVLMEIGRFILFVYNRDVIHVHQTSQTPERQVGVMRLIVRLWIYFLKQLEIKEREVFNFEEFINCETSGFERGVDVKMTYVKIFGKKYASDYESIRVTCKSLFENTIKYIHEYQHEPEVADNSPAEKASRIWFHEIVSKETELLNEYSTKFYG